MRYVKNRSRQLLGWTTEDKSTEHHDSKGRLLTTSDNITTGLIFDDDD